MARTIARVSHITKRYPGALALDDVSVAFEEGSVHALVGENGAGKSTHIKILSGREKPDTGRIEVGNVSCEGLTPTRALSLGIATIYQETMLAGDLSVAENIFLGRMGRSAGTLVDTKALSANAESILGELDCPLDPRCPVSELGVSDAQFVAIAKAVALNASMVIMDEPTAALTEHEAEALFGLIGALKRQGKAVVYITHRLDEVYRLADTITVMRDGRAVRSAPAGQIPREELVRLIVGRDMSAMYPTRNARMGDAVIEAEGVSSPGAGGLCFKVRRGEVLGFAGLAGSGLHDIALLLFGLQPLLDGALIIKGRPRRLRSPRDAVANGIGYVPADRKSIGVLLELPVADNITLASLRDVSRFGIVDSKAMQQEADEYISGLRIKCASSSQPVGSLSGGNQQKVALSKWLASNADILVLEDPTQGVDVGARHEIYRLINSLAARGVAIVVMSSDVDELVGIADRIVVMREGSQVSLLEKEHYDKELLMEIMVGSPSVEGGVR